MRVIVPHEIDLRSTNVTANTEDEWSPVPTYGLGAEVQVTTSTPHTVYRSLRGNNTNRPPADWLVPQVEVGTSTTSNSVEQGDKTFTVQAGLGFSTGMQVRISKTTTPASVNLTGEVISYTSGTGVLIVTVASITGTGSHAEWTVESVDEIGFWKEVSATNQYKMFDDFVNTQTVMDGEIFVKLNTTRADYVTLFGIEGTDVDFELWDSTETTLMWSASVSLVYGTEAVVAITDWYEYFFGEISAKTDVGIDLGVITYKGVLTIRITGFTDADAKCGGVIVGRAYNLGVTQLGATASIIDFSERTTDDAGRTYVKPGYWAKRNTIPLLINNRDIDAVYKILASLRGIPTAWLGNNDSEFETMVVFGTCRDFSIAFSGPNRSGIDIEIEGLI